MQIGSIEGTVSMYSLSYEMMVQVLQQFGYSGEVHADVSPDSILRRSGRIVLVVQGGTITTCIILNQDGQKLYHDAQALSLVSRLGVLEWRLVSSPTPRFARSPSQPFAAESPSKGTTFYPRRLIIPLSQMRSWPILYRYVYSLADGTRSLEQIASLLSQTPRTIEQAVQNLQAIGGIARANEDG